MNPVKVEGITKWPAPKHVKDVQSFLGFENFYYWFLKDFFEITHPLFNLTKKD